MAEKTKVEELQKLT